MLAEWKYVVYMVFMGLLSYFFSMFKHLPMIELIRRFEFATILFTANFFLEWFALQDRTRGLLVDTYPLAYKIIFFTTMISAPGVILYTVAAWFIPKKFFSKRELLSQVIAPSYEI